MTLRAAQDAEAKLLAEVLATIEAVNENIQQKLKLDDFQTVIDTALQQPVPDNGWVCAQIRKKAAEIKKAEEEIALKAAAEAKLEAQKEIEKVRREAEDARASLAVPQRMTLPTQIPDDGDDDEVIALGTPAEALKPSPLVNEKTNVVLWQMVVQLRGADTNLKVVGEQLRGICEANHVGFYVDKQQSKKIG